MRAEAYAWRAAAMDMAPVMVAAAVVMVVASRRGGIALDQLYALRATTIMLIPVCAGRSTECGSIAAARAPPLFPAITASRALNCSDNHPARAHRPKGIVAAANSRTMIAPPKILRTMIAAPLGPAKSIVHSFVRSVEKPLKIQ